MCGFVGIVGTGPGRDALQAMLASIRARGPDDAGCVSDTWFSLGFCRLAILSVQDGRQPVANAGRDVHLAFNGEIYNFTRLQSELAAQEPGRRCTSEAEVLLRLFEREGPSFVDRLDGDFAIAVFDTKRRLCYVFRDCFGVKPLYYVRLGGGKTWILSSDLRAFFSFPGFSTGMDWLALAERKTLHFWSAGRTCFEGIHQLLPGHWLRLEVRGPDEAVSAEVRRYCGVAEAPAADDGGGGEGADEECRALVRRAVQKRIRHTEVQPVLLALSGGCDSSLIAACAAHQGDEVAAVTLYDNPECGDQLYSAALAKNLGLRHHLHEIGLGEFLDQYPEMVLASGGTGPVYLTYLMARFARECEPLAKVILCGEGADEIFLGYPLAQDPSAYVAGAQRALAAVDRQLVEQSGLLQRVLQWQGQSREEVWLDLVRLFRCDQLANGHLVPFDHGPMAFGLECRVPFLDRTLVDFMRRVPERRRLSAEATKLFIRRALCEELRGLPGVLEQVLQRRPTPAFFATLGCRDALRQLVRVGFSRNPLAGSAIARYAVGLEDLFWFSCVAVIFLRHRGRIDGMTFEDLCAEVFTSEAVV